MGTAASTKGSVPSASGPAASISGPAAPTTGPAAPVPTAVPVLSSIPLPSLPNVHFDFLMDEEDLARERQIKDEFDKAIIELKALRMGLKLTEDDVRHLHMCYAYIDKSSTSLIQVSAFLEFLRVLKTPFTDRIINYFQEVGSKHLRAMDFRTFLKISWSYCTLDHAELVHFVYDLYDPEERQELGSDELTTMLGDLFGRNFMLKDEVVGIIEEYARTTKEHGPLSMPDFRKYVKNHQKLLFPAFQFQLYMRQNIVGELFWERLTQQRLDMFKSGKLIKEADFKALETQTGVDFYRNGTVDADAVANAGDKVYHIRDSDRSPLGRFTGTTSTQTERRSMSIMAGRAANPQGNALYMYNIKKAVRPESKTDSRPTSKNIRARIEAEKNA